MHLMTSQSHTTLDSEMGLGEGLPQSDLLIGPGIVGSGCQTERASLSVWFYRPSRNVF